MFGFFEKENVVSIAMKVMVISSNLIEGNYGVMVIRLIRLIKETVTI